MPHRYYFPPDYVKRSSTILNTALNCVAAYRSWRKSDPGPESSVDKRYTALPALTKAGIRRYFPEGMAPAGCGLRDALTRKEIDFVKTSGSSDVSVTNIWNQQWWNDSEKASWQLNSYARALATGCHPEAILANPRNVGFISDKVDLPFDKRRLLRFLYLNEKSDPTSWTPEHMERMIREMAAFQPVVLEANPSLLARLCRFIVSSGREVFQPGLIVLTYEYPTRLHLKQIGAVFKSPVASSYGTTETGYVFMQCEAGKFHQNTEFCRVDFQPLKPEHGGPGLGRMLVTTFNNPWYYIVRFDVGDILRLDESTGCPCGRQNGMIARAVEGRSANATLTTTGRLVSQGEADGVISPVEGIDEYRLDQPSPGIFELHLVSHAVNRNSLAEEASERLKQIYGRDAEISIIFEKDIAPENSGKYRTTRPFFTIDIENYLDITAPGDRE